MLKLKLSGFTLTIFFFIIGLAQGAALFSDDFESGSLKKWATTTGVSISTDAPYNGKYCAKIDYGVNTLQALIATLSLPPTQEFYVSFYTKFANSYNAPYLGYKWMRLKHGNVDGIQTEFFLNSESWVSTGHSYQTGTGALGFPNTGLSWFPSMKNGEWHRIEVYGKYNTSGQSNGICTIKVNGSQIFESKTYVWRTGIYARDVFTRFYIPSNAGDGTHRSSSGDIVYIDNVEIWGVKDSADQIAIPGSPTNPQIIAN